MPCVENATKETGWIHRTPLIAKKRKLKRRRKDIRGVVIHTTGSGPWTRWQGNRAQFVSPFMAASYIYEHISIYSPHFLVCGDTGEVMAYAATDFHCFHVGSRGSRAYRSKKWNDGRFDWWERRFPGIIGPRGLLDGHLWRKGSANALTVGIEVSPPRSGPRDAWSDLAWDSLRGLVGWLANENDFPRDRYHVFTHSDAHPLARSTASGRPWDVGPSQYTIGKAVQRLNLTR